MTKSEIARLRARLVDEYRAAQWGLCGLASGTSRHQFITTRMERISACEEQLENLVGEVHAVAIIKDALLDVPRQASRNDVLAIVLSEFGNTEDSATLIDWLKDGWETVDLLTKKFGLERAKKLLLAPTANSNGVPADTLEQHNADLPTVLPLATSNQDHHVTI